MPNPLSDIGKVLGKLAEKVDVLPATGGAVEDLLHPEVEEREDQLLNREERLFDTVLETPAHELYRPVPPLPRIQEHCFRYFLDGSFRSYFIGTALEQGKDTPVHFAQVGVAVLHRLDDGNVKCDSLEIRNLLVLAKSALSDEAWSAVEVAARGLAVELADAGEKHVLSPESGEAIDLRNKAAGKIRFEMHRLETKATLDKVAAVPNGEWVIADGSLCFEPMLSQLCQSGSPRVLGVAKSFRRDPEFKVGRGIKGQRLNLTKLLAQLPNSHRTLAFGAKNGKLAFWYVRIREQGVVDYPLMGVIKVELANPSQSAVDTQLIDFLSRCLVAERSVTPHGVERRWHACLYPIYVAEQAIKNAFFSREVIRASLRWPVSLGR